MVQTSAEFKVAALLLAVAFLLGGGARADVASLMILRPLGILGFGFALWRLDGPLLRQNRFLFVLTASILALPALHLVPLPPFMWQALPGRELVSDIDRTLGLGSVWRPISLVPGLTRNALAAAALPVGILLLGLRLGERELHRLLGVALLLGSMSAALGVIQLAAGREGTTYFYAITNNGSAVGLFANRNHQALLLAAMIPMLAAFACHLRLGDRRQHLWLLGAALGTFCLLPLILATGSRAGLLLGCFGLLCAGLIASEAGALPRTAQTSKVKRWLPAILGLVLLALAAAAITLGRAEAWTRLLDSGGAGELRLRVLPALFALGTTYWPVGSGIGSFERAYQAHEPDGLLSSIYLNHAHNDWIEPLITGGLPAAILLLAASAAFGVQAWRALQPQRTGPSRVLMRMGLCLILLSALASISDYPLRVPALSCLLAVAVLWANYDGARGTSPA